MIIQDVRMETVKIQSEDKRENGRAGARLRGSTESERGTCQKNNTL